jgi:hypothetical protein
MFNQVINFSWTILAFFPVCFYWWNQGVDWAFYAFLAVSLIAGCLPQKIYNQLSMGTDPAAYINLGVRTIRKFVQDGGFKRNKLQGMRSYLNTIAMYERYHFICLVFFKCSSVYACLHEHIILGLLIFLVNVVYNVCPILLQQYNRLRIVNILTRMQ